MEDETYVFISDVKDKKITARSARKQRTHTGKGGRVRLPHDNLSKKELEKMNGECKSYRLNDPMTWNEFMSMPDDIKITYVKLLRQKFNVPGKYIAEMLGRNASDFSKEINRLGISEGKNCRGRCTPWDREGFYAWWKGVDKVEKLTITMEDLPEIDKDMVSGIKHMRVMAEAYVEDDLPFEEPDPIKSENVIALRSEIEALENRIDELLKSNEELMAVHEKDKQEITWLRNECDRYHRNSQLLEAQMDVVRLIFGGNGNGN